MPKDKKNDGSSGKSLSIILLNCFINALVSFLVFVALSSAYCMVSDDAALYDSKTKIILYIILALSSVLNGLLCALRLKIKAIVSSLSSGVISACFVFLLFAVLSGFSFSVNSLVSFAIIISVTVSSGVIFKNLFNK